MFKEYQSKPITRLAHEVTTDCTIMQTSDEATSQIFIGGVWLYFKHYELVSVGDWIVYINETDVYHCSNKVFRSRNIVMQDK
jgi:hypothetical protein